MGNALKNLQDLTDLNGKFRQMCLYYSDLLALEGKKVRPFRSPDLPVFSALTAEQKKSAIDFIGTALEIFEETRAEGFKLNDSPRLLWRALRKLGWTPQSDVFDRMGEKDVINIYTPQNIQIFQNLNFFDWVTLTLEDLYGAPWHAYSRREAKCAEQADQTAVELFTGILTSTVTPDIPEHYVEEIGTDEAYTIFIKIHTVSPLRQNGQVVGLWPSIIAENGMGFRATCRFFKHH